jgi:hypothetical protein
VPKSSDPLAGLSPLAQQIASVVGRRADDPAVVAFVTNTLGQKVPATVTASGGSKYVLAKKLGVELLFGHDVKNEKYPLVAKTAKSFIPYLQLAWMTKKFKELPFGIEFGMEPNEVTKRFGVEPETTPLGPRWTRVLDAAGEIELDYDGRECRIVVDQAGELISSYGAPATPAVGVFAAWAAQRGLLDPARAGTHAALFEEVRTGKRKGRELLDAAWPRGLWDVHLIDKPGLRQFAYRWFHRLGDAGYIRDDLVAVFGGREGPTGHQEPVLDDDDADAVQKATPKLDAVFAPWLD